jgi:thiamine-phosphate pyrophosphorylase
MQINEDGQGGVAGVWRAIDASANRAAEAVRVLEDVARFVLDDVALTSLAKQLRHELAAALAHRGLESRIALRDVSGDVGAGMAKPGALPRASVADLVAANAARGTQAARSLEECVAVVAPEAAAAFERIRYRLYALDRGMAVAVRSRDRLAGIRLCVLVDGRGGQEAFERLVESLLEAGVRMLQIRDKSLAVPALAARAAAAVTLARRHDRERPALVIVNDRADVAAAINADGAHTGADDLAAPLVRRVIGPDRLLGRTAHDFSEARAAADEGADYLGIGPCFPSHTKSFGEFAPREFLARVATEIALPAFAIGGVTRERLESLAVLGIRRVAVASAITAAAAPAAEAAAFIERLAELDPPA